MKSDTGLAAVPHLRKEVKDDAHHFPRWQVHDDHNHQGNPSEGSQRKKRPPLGQVTEVFAVF